jgi:hypothetical protein
MAGSRAAPAGAIFLYQLLHFSSFDRTVLASSSSSSSSSSSRSASLARGASPSG